MILLSYLQAQTSKRAPFIYFLIIYQAYVYLAEY